MKIFRFVSLAIACLVATSVYSQNFFNHLSAGVSLGTDGIGIELATPIGHFVEMRAGYSFMPKFKYSTDVDVNSKTTPKVDVEGKLNMGDAKLLFDFYPIMGHGFHLTAGAYIGKSEIVTVRNTSPIPISEDEYGKTGIIIGDYLVTTDLDGNAKATIKTHSFKPYLGFGFGRGCSKFVNIQFNAGVELWGSPGVYAWNPNENVYVKAKEEDFEDKTASGAIKAISKIGVWPVVNLRVAFRAF